MEHWVEPLQRGDTEQAWDAFIGQYRRLVFASIQHYTRDHDDVMDVFARVCDALREDDLRRLRAWVGAPGHRARFSTWLVTVVRHLTVDWYRRLHGHRHVTKLAETLPPRQRRIFELVFENRRSHVEAFEDLRSHEAPALRWREFAADLRATYAAVQRAFRGGLLRDLGSPPPPDPEASASLEPGEPAEQRAVLERAMACLAAEERVAIELFVVEDMSAEAVARVLGLSNAKAVYNRVYRALARVKEQFDKAGIRREDV
jgi:RNA polymerase sigma factor (sigma-70 family)